MRNLNRSLIFDALLILPAIAIVISLIWTPQYLEAVYDDEGGLMVWQAPTADRWLGTDGLGYDVWDFLRISLATELKLFAPALVLFLVIGLTIGISLSYAKGTANRFFDVLFNLLTSIPLLLILLLIIIIIEGFFPSFDTFKKLLLLFSIFGIVSSSKLAIEIRGKIDTVKRTDFIESSKALGLTPTKILFKHILYYNCLTIIIANILNFLAQLIFIEITLAYLNLGAGGKVISLGYMFKQYFLFIDAFTSLGEWQIAVPSIIAVYFIIVTTVFAGKWNHEHHG